MGCNDDSQYAFNWNNHMSHIRNALVTLLTENELVDVTLCCEGGRLTAHKMLLSMCSPYFRDVFKENPCSHPIVILKDVNYRVMQDLLHFMYDGEVSVESDDFDSFLKTAELLEICGLTESVEEEKGDGDEMIGLEGRLTQRKRRKRTVDKIIKKKEDGEADEVDVSIAARASSESEHSMEIAHSDSGRIEHYSAPDLDIKNEEKFRNDNVVEDNAIVDNFQLDPLAEQVLCDEKQNFDFKEVRNLIEGKPCATSLHLHRCFSSTSTHNKKSIQKSSISNQSDGRIHHCKLCNKSFSHEKSYEQHKNVHKGRTRCPICAKILCRKYQVKVHLFKQHGVGNLTTEQMASLLGTIVKKKSMKVKSLPPPEPVITKCSECGRQYKNPKSLEQHMVMHKGKTKCHICDKVLCRKYELKLHLKNTHGI